jgi:hypothetical protein
MSATVLMKVNRVSKSLIFLGLLVLTDVVVNSCQKCGNPGDCSFVRYHEPKVTSKDGRLLTHTDTSKIIEDTLRLQLALRKEFFTFLDRPGFNLLSSNAYACSPCMPGELGSKENMERFEILSDQDFDNTHPKNTSLNDLFEISQFTLDTLPHSRLDSFINNAITHKSIPFNTNNWQLRSAHKPASEKTHRLRFEVDYSDGRKDVTDAGVFVF